MKTLSTMILNYKIVYYFSLYYSVRKMLAICLLLANSKYSAN